MQSNPANYHRRSIRLRQYDYSEPGGYFITICAYNRECLFGDIVNGDMRLNPFGRIVDEEWKGTSLTRPNVELDTYVIMPNHLHGIIILNDPDRGTSQSTRRGVLPYAPTKFASPSKNIGVIIRGFESTTTKRINEMRT